MPGNEATEPATARLADVTPCPSASTKTAGRPSTNVIEPSSLRLPADTRRLSGLSYLKKTSWASVSSSTALPKGVPSFSTVTVSPSMSFSCSVFGAKPS